MGDDGSSSAAAAGTGTDSDRKEENAIAEEKASAAKTSTPKDLKAALESSAPFMGQPAINRSEMEINEEEFLKDCKMAKNDFQRLRKAYDETAADHPPVVGKAISKRQREEAGMLQEFLVYGEVGFLPVFESIWRIKTRYGGLDTPGPHTFYDLGCGTGKPCIAAVLAHGFTSVHGVEILDGLYKAALEVKAKWDVVLGNRRKGEDSGNRKGSARDATIEAAADGEHGKDGTRSQELWEAMSKAKIKFSHGDFTANGFSVKGADICFANSTCYTKEIMDSLANKAEAMRPGSFCITLTKRLPSSSWEILERTKYRMSWGTGTVYIHRKLPQDESVANE